MQKTSSLRNPAAVRTNMSFVIAFFLSITLLNLTAVANGNKMQGDSTVEKRVDYLEWIYFSGENKAGLQIKIQIALQDIETKQATAALAKQASFLLDIKDKAANAKNACEILDMIAAGIYGIDAAEAVTQGVNRPSDKAKANVGDALDNVGKIGASATTISSSASSAAWSDWLINNGHSSGFGRSAAKISNVTGNAGNLMNGVGQAGKAGKQISDLAGGMFGKKDKSCSDVTPKNIEIGNHAGLQQKAVSAAVTTEEPKKAEPNTTTVISIAKISSSQLKELADAIKSKTGVATVERAFDATSSSITVSHTGSTDALSDWIEENHGKKFKTLGYSSGKINLAMK